MFESFYRASRIVETIIKPPPGQYRCCFNLTSKAVPMTRQARQGGGGQTEEKESYARCCD